MISLLRAAATGLLVSTSTIAMAQDVPIVMPGAPGENPRVLSASEATALADTAYSPADVEFMQGMIVHHEQAVAMSSLVNDRTNNDAVVKIAAGILATQADEIEFMTEWLISRGQGVNMPGMSHAAHSGHADHGGMAAHAGHHTMAGMATPEQMAELATLNGTAFDRMFLQLMVEHHRGALAMVRDLHRAPGSAYDPVMFEFTNDVVSDQQAEIDRMNAVLADLSEDPRANLAAGFRDAGEAIMNLRLVAAQPKPTGFFDPANPAQLRPRIERDAKDTEVDEPTDSADADAEEETPRFGRRGSLLDFANTDIAFSNDLMVAGSYHGFNAYRLGEDGVPQLVSSTVCPGGQGDVSIVGDLLIMSVQDSRARIDCGLQGVAGRVNEERFRGLRIFDISDITRPRQVGLVQTCRGSHTHSIVEAYRRPHPRLQFGHELHP